jgi:hypothetical protein
MMGHPFTRSGRAIVKVVLDPAPNARILRMLELTKEQFEALLKNLDDVCRSSSGVLQGVDYVKLP